MFDHADLDRLFLVVANFNLKGFGSRALADLHDVIGAPPFTGQIEGVAGVDAHGFVAGRVIDDVFAGEVDLAIVVAAVEAHPAFSPDFRSRATSCRTTAKSW